MWQVAVTIPASPTPCSRPTTCCGRSFDAEGRFVIDQALDTHVMNQIIAAAPPFGTTGTGLVAQVRNAITAMRAEGANPDLLVVNAADAAALDLTADGGGYVFTLNETGASPLWSLRIIERPGTTPDDPALHHRPGDHRAPLPRRHAVRRGPVHRVQEELTTLRVETSALFRVRNARGARRITVAR